MCITTINDRKVPINLKEKQEGCMEKLNWNRLKGKWYNHTLQSYKKEEILFKTEKRYSKKDDAM